MFVFFVSFWTNSCCISELCCVAFAGGSREVWKPAVNQRKYYTIGSVLLFIQGCLFSKNFWKEKSTISSYFMREFVSDWRITLLKLTHYCNSGNAVFSCCEFLGHLEQSLKGNQHDRSYFVMGCNPYTWIHKSSCWFLLFFFVNLQIFCA